MRLHPQMRGDEVDPCLARCRASSRIESIDQPIHAPFLGSTRKQLPLPKLARVVEPRMHRAGERLDPFSIAAKQRFPQIQHILKPSQLLAQSPAGAYEQCEWLSRQWKFVVQRSVDGRESDSNPPTKRLRISSDQQDVC